MGNPTLSSRLDGKQQRPKDSQGLRPHFVSTVQRAPRKTKEGSVVQRETPNVVCVELRYQVVLHFGRAEVQKTCNEALS